MSSFLTTTSDADIILRPSGDDGVEIHAHRCILSAASPFFQTMFSLPQKDAGGIQVIPLPESPFVVDTLLQFIYPVPDPTISSLGELVDILAAATKYDCVAPIASLRRTLVSHTFLRDEPTRVYAIACRFDLHEEARIASRYTLDVNVLDCPLSDDLKHISAYSYHQLLDLHRRRGRAALELLKAGDEIKCMQCNGNSFSVYSSPKWWSEFEKRAKEELRVRPTSNVIFTMEFLSEVANAGGCVRCPGSVLNSHRYLTRLKESIDALPATI
ncbi:BTB domain-containing protein [Pleurotus pulmonarius]